MTKKLIVAALALAMVSLAVGPALAQWRGPGWGGGGYGWCGGGPGAMMWGPNDQATNNLRSELWNKQRTLYNEMAKDRPDAAKVKALTQEINALRTKLMTRATEYNLKNPDARRYAYRGWRGGPGWRRGPGRGYGPGGGGCW
jgi:Spy/CpxP family protein refolding chaperone